MDTGKFARCDGLSAAGKILPTDELGYLSAVQVRRRYSISNSTLYKWVAERRFPSPVKIGARAVRWSAKDLAEFEKKLKIRESKQELSSNLFLSNPGLATRE